MTYDYLIVGGGPHGCCMARYIQANNLGTHLIIESGPELLHRWKYQTRNCEMKFLRSNYTYGIDVDASSMLVFGQGNYPLEDSTRPSLKLFNDHSDHVCLGLVWVSGVVEQINPRDDNTFDVTTTSQTYNTRKVILSIGSPVLNKPYPDIPHVFDVDFHADATLTRPPIVIIGGGISAAHLVCHYGAKYPGEVWWIQRHNPVRSSSDVDSRWSSLAEVKSFQCLSLEQRSQLINRERRDGTLPDQVVRNINSLDVRMHVGEIKEVVSKQNQTFDIRLDSSTLISDASAVQATGFVTDWKENPLLRQIQDKCGGDVDAQGRPILSNNLEWSPNIYASGQLAELKLGPAGRNIAGAKLATQLMFA